MGVDATGSGPKYRFIRDIAEGGMGAVSLAVREEGAFRRVYAIKRLLPEFRRDPRVRSMFMDEARIAGLLHHPNVVSVVDVGEDEGGPYLVMDYVQGVPLAALVRAAKQRKDLLPVQVCVRIVKDIAEGLDAAHELAAYDGTELGLVHRDVSPQNVLVGYDGISRLTDFGIAKALGREERTSTGVLKGKFGYFAPERLQFEEPTRLSDIFSLGVVMYEALSGDRLYRGGNQAEVARRILKEETPDIGQVRDVHPLIVELLFQMLAKEPERRPQTASEVARRLDAILLDLVAEEGPKSVADHMVQRFAVLYEQQKRELDELTAGVELHRVSIPPEWFRRKGPRLGAAFVALVVAGALGAWSVFDRGTDIPTAPRGVPGLAGTGTVTEAETETQTVTEAETEVNNTQPSPGGVPDRTSPVTPPPFNTETVTETEAKATPTPKKRRPRARPRPKKAATAKSEPDTPNARDGLMGWRK